MSNLKIALLQLTPQDTIEKQLIKGLEACGKARAMGADVALFPEMWSIGYQIPQDQKELHHKAVSRDSHFVKAFGTAARELQMAIGITYLEQYEDSCRNTITVFDRNGQDVLTYAKIHTCVFADERVLTAGEHFSVTILDTSKGTVQIGAMICFDREFPESARVLMLQGAELILVPNACPMEINRLSQLRSRAYENMVGIITVNYPTGTVDCNGHSTAFDGIAFQPEDPVTKVGGSRDMLLMETGEEEGIYLVSFPIQELRDYRRREVWGNAYRKPDKYELLCTKEIREPFIRTGNKGDSN